MILLKMNYNLFINYMLENSESIIRESLESYLNYQHQECVLKTEMSKPHLR